MSLNEQHFREKRRVRVFDDKINFIMTRSRPRRSVHYKRGIKSQ